MHCVRHCCRSPVASCHSRLPLPVACSINKMSEMHCRASCKRGRDWAEWRTDWRSESIGCPISRHDWYMACIDMDTVLDFHFVGPSTALSAQCKRTSHRQHPTSRHPQHHVSMCQSVSQSVNVCISQFQISALGPHPTSRLRLLLLLLLLFDRPSIYITWARQRPQAQRQEATRLAPSLGVFPILNSNSQLVCKLLAPSEFWFVWNTFTQIWK